MALHHYLSWHSVVPAPRTILAGVRKLAPATVLIVEPDGRRRAACTGTRRFARDPARADWTPEDWQDAVLEALRIAVDRRMVADVPVGVLLSGGLDSSLIVALLAQAGPARPGRRSASASPPRAGREGDEFAYSDLVAERFDTDHRQIRVDDDRLLPALHEAVGAMSEPMVSHDCVAFYLLSEEVSRAREGRAVRAGRRRDLRRLLLVPAPAGGRGDGFDAYARGVLRPPARGARRRCWATAGGSTRTSAGAFAAEHFARPGADGPVDRALRLDSEVMLVDDPVKRVDNMTMAFGLEARTPFLDHDLVELAAACPPALKLAHGGKGVLKDAARGLVLPAAGHRPAQGLLPGPGAVATSRARRSSSSREALTPGAARERGALRPGVGRPRCSPTPNEHLTTLQGHEPLAARPARAVAPERRASDEAECT